MPKFRDSKNPALNELNTAKKQVVKRNRKKYSAVQADVPAEGVKAVVPSEGDSRAFGSLYSKGTEIASTLEEITSATNIYIEESVDRFDEGDGEGFEGEIAQVNEDVLVDNIREFSENINPLSTKLAKDIKGGLAALAALNYNISSLSDVEQSQVVAMFEDLNKRTDEFTRAYRDLEDTFHLYTEDEPYGVQDRNAHAKWRNLDNIFKRFLRLLDTFTEQLKNAIESYRQIPEGAGYVGGSRGKRTMLGDDVEELLTRGYMNRQPLAPIVQAFAPRNTFDLPNLPRRFL